MNASRNVSLTILIFMLLANFAHTAELSKQSNVQVEEEESSIIQHNKKINEKANTYLDVIIGGDLRKVQELLENEPSLISWVAKLGEECNEYGIPFIAEAEYPASYEPGAEKIKYGEHLEYLKRSARLCAELGADIIKTNWTGDADSFQKIIEVVPDMPVVVAGGSKESDEDLLTKIEEALKAGAIGCSVGRNIFQHSNPEAISKAIADVVHRRASAQEAAEALRNKMK